MGADVLASVFVRSALVIGVAAALALALRTIRLPGGKPCAALAGAVLAGILLGPGVFGSVSPEAYERWMVGGREAREQLQALEAQQHAQREALAASGVSAVALDELAARQADARRPLEGALADAIAAERRAWEQAAVAAAAALAALGGWTLRRRRARSDGTRAGEHAGPGAVLAGILAAALTALPVALAMVWLTPASRAQGLAVGAALAGGALAPGLTLRWVAAAGRGPIAGLYLVSCLLAAAGGLGVALGLAGVAPARAAAWALTPLVALGAGVLLARAAPPGARLRRLAGGAALWVLTPMLAGSLGAWLEPGLLARPGAILLLLAGALLAGDGHLLGAWLGFKSAGAGEERGSIVLRTAEAHGRGVPLTQCAWATVLVAAGVVDPSTRAGAAAIALVLVTALSTELLLDWTRPLARRMDRGEF